MEGRKDYPRDSSVTIEGIAINWADMVEEEDSQKNESILTECGFALDAVSHNVAAIMDGLGVRPSDPATLRSCAQSLFFGSATHNGVPVIEYAEGRVQDEVRTDSVKRFGYLEGRMAYPKTDVLPQMGIGSNGEDPGMVDELDSCDFFLEDDCELDDEAPQLVVCERNATSSFEPVQSMSSDEFKIVNDVVKRYQKNFQNFIFGRVAVLGSGVVTLRNNFDFSNVEEVIYYDTNDLVVEELSKRLEGVPFEYSVVVGSLEDMEGQFDVIITNHSWHHIVGGVHPADQRDKCLTLISKLKENGVWLGAGPSIGGMTSTPCTLEVRSPSGLYGFNCTEEGAYTSFGQFANCRYTEPVFFSTLLHGFEEGVGQVVHLSQFNTEGLSPDLVRMYEGFSFLKGKSRPDGVSIHTYIDRKALTNFDLVGAVKISIVGREPSSFFGNPISGKGNFSLQTKGQLLLATHFSPMCYQGPFLVSEKLDGEIVALTAKDDFVEVLRKNGSGWLVPGYKGPEFFGYGEYINGKIYWLETTSRSGLIYSSWIHGLRSWLPKWLGIKNYRSFDQANVSRFQKLCKEGIVIHDPNTPCGSGLPRQYFLKHIVTMDVLCSDGKVYEKDGQGQVCKERDVGHEPNGFMRVVEGPFTVTFGVLLEWLKIRDLDKATELEGMSLYDILSYPRNLGTPGNMRIRNTALQQLWRGYTHMDDFVRDFVHLFVPFGRPAGVEGVCSDLIESILNGGAPDKDGFVERAKNQFEMAKREAEDEASLVEEAVNYSLTGDPAEAPDFDDDMEPM